MCLHEVVSEFLIQRLGKPSLLPEFGRGIAIGLGDGIESGPGQVAQNGGVVPG